MIIIYCLHACTSTPFALHCIMLLTYLPDLHTALVAYLQASHTHAHATHTSRHFPNHDACMHTYICTCDFSNAQLRLSACAISFTHA